jgi:hypothetical protein
MSMEATIQNPAAGGIQWKQLWSLAALYASIVIGWIAYQNYQPKLLVQFKFTDFTFLLLVAQGIILVLTPPIAGRLGDRYRFQKGHRIPIISSGISFAAMIFMAVAFTLFGNPGEIFKWILPVLIIFWLIAMSIFTSPALSTVELFTPVEKLPKAMAIITIVSNLLYALEPVIVDIIDFIGAPLTFIAGGAVVFFSGYALKKNSLSLFKLSNDHEAKPMASFKIDTQRSQKGFILFLGLAVGAATSLMFNVFPDIFHTKLTTLTNIEGKVLVVDMLVLSALLSWPISNLVTKVGMSRMFWISLVLLAISGGAIFLSGNVWLMFIMIVVYATMFTSLSVSALPLAISRANYYEKVFCVGIFFSGVALPDGVMQVLQTLG